MNADINVRKRQILAFFYLLDGSKGAHFSIADSPILLLQLVKSVKNVRVHVGRNGAACTV
jgi:hypothetical protein